MTLEPCAHHGRTPPCAPLVRDAGVARVVAAIRDPNPLVRGPRPRAAAPGRDRGRDAALLAAEAARLERALPRRAARLGRPFVLLKAALTLDGRIATASGDSKWITSAAQRRAGAVAAPAARRRARRRRHRARRRPAAAARRRARGGRSRGSCSTRACGCPPAAGSSARAAPRTPVARGRRARPARAPAPRSGGARRRRSLAVAAGGDASSLADARSTRSRARGLTSLMVEGGSEVLGSFLRRAARRPGGALPGAAPAGRARQPAGLRRATTRRGSATRCALEPRAAPAPARSRGRGPPQFELWRPGRGRLTRMFTGIVEGTGTVESGGAARRRDDRADRRGRALRGPAARRQRRRERLLPHGRALGRAGLRRGPDRGDAAAHALRRAARPGRAREPRAAR